VGSKGEVLDASVGKWSGRGTWLSDQAARAPVHLNKGALDRLRDHVGDDWGRVEATFDILAAAYGEGASIDVERLEPFLGSAGGVPPWELTDAIDAGKIPDALQALRRRGVGGGHVPAETLATLHRHYQDLLRWDGAAPGDGAAQSFPARKAQGQARRLGSERIGEAIALIAAADLDLKGKSGLEGTIVLEILVARLTRLARARPAHR
jgi:DNA polymerase III subunit delta